MAHATVRLLLLAVREEEDPWLPFYTSEYQKFKSYLVTN